MASNAHSDCLQTPNYDTVLRCHICHTLAFLILTPDDKYVADEEKPCENRACDVWNAHALWGCRECSKFQWRLMWKCSCCETENICIFSSTGAILLDEPCNECGYPEVDSACMILWRRWVQRTNTAMEEEVDLDELRLENRREKMKLENV